MVEGEGVPGVGEGLYPLWVTLLQNWDNKTQELLLSFPSGIITINQTVDWYFYANENRVDVSGPKHFMALTLHGPSVGRRGGKGNAFANASPFAKAKGEALGNRASSRKCMMYLSVA